ncbi:hypothetical protein Tco_0196241 [Tanacetum coccineum]
MSRVNAWNDVVERFTKRLSSWKAKILSIGGRYTLVKAVLGSLPLYYFSLFRTPDQKNSTADYQMGGLGIGHLKSKNLSLVGKWWWRFLNEKDALLCKVISAHGIDGGLSLNPRLGLKIGVWESIIDSGFLIDKSDDLNDLISSLNLPPLVVDSIDYWKWVLSPKGVFTVNYLSRSIDKHLAATSPNAQIMQWNPWLPKKLVWSIPFPGNRLNHVLPLMSSPSIPGLCKTWTRVFRGVCSVALWLIWKWRNAAFLSSPESREAIITSDPFA